MRWPRLDHFDLAAPFYERVISHAEPEWLADLLDLSAGGRLLDVGGGTGRVSGALAERVAQVVLTDPSWGMLRQARAKARLESANAHAERLPFTDGAFDRILMVDAFHHVCDQDQTVAEMLRVLAPGGRLVVEEPNIETVSVKLVALAEKLAFMRSHFVRPAVMAGMFRAHGARAEVRELPGNPNNIWLIVEH